MYLKKLKRGDRVYLSIAKSYRGKDGKSKTKTMMKIGYADEFIEKYKDPIAHFTQVAKEMTEKENKEKSQTITFDLSEDIEPDTDSVFQIGDIVFSKLYHQLQLHELLLNRARHQELSYIPNNIMKTLVIGRLFAPDSKKATFENKDTFFESHNFSLDNLYDSLDFFAPLRKDVIHHLNKVIPTVVERDTSVCLYDVTNYYCEIDDDDADDGLRKRGMSKENKRTPIIQMGLATDKNGIPLSYDLFEGNTHDSKTFQPIFRELKKSFQTEKVIICADKGLNSADNISYATIQGNGYVIGERVAGGAKDLSDFIFDTSGYNAEVTFNEDMLLSTPADTFSKSRIIEREINVTNDKGKKVKTTIEQKQIIFWSRKYDVRAKAKRAEQIQKAQDIINSPSSYNRKTHKGALSFINEDAFDAETGELIENKKLSLNIQKINEQAKYDGFYMIITSEIDTSDDDVIKMYRGLWKIEETFKVTKSYLSARPIYLQKQEHIKAHFLVCYIALTLMRITEELLSQKLIKPHMTPKEKAKVMIGPKTIIDELSKLTVTHLKDNLYQNNYSSEICNKILKAFNIDLSKHYYAKKDLRALFGDVKRIYE